METSKEKMSEYLEKMQLWQRMVVGMFDAHLEITNGGYEDVSITLRFFVWREGTIVEHPIFEVMTWHTEDVNDAKMKQCYEYLVKKGVFE